MTNINETLEEFAKSILQHDLPTIQYILQHIDKSKYPDRYKAVLDRYNEIKDNPVYKKEEEQPSIYGGFLRRLTAAMIDIVYLNIIYFIIMLLVKTSVHVTLSIVTIWPIIATSYYVIFHAKYGATLGKLKLGLQIRHLNLDTISWKAALKRQSVDIVISLLIVVAVILNLAHISNTEAINTLKDSNNLIEFANNKLSSIVYVLFQIWALSELIVLLLNDKKRAAHDYIAGTVVVVKSRIEPKEN